MATATKIPDTQAAASRRMYNSTADVYDNSHHPKFALDLLNLVEVRSGEHVLDLACGTGLGTLPAAEMVGPSGYVVGIDVSDGMLAEAHRKVAAAGYGGFVKLFNHSISELPSLLELRGKEGTFDLVTCCSALVLLDDPIAALRQWTAYLKPGTGRLVFDITHPSTQPQGYLLGIAAKSLGLPMYQNRTWASGEDALRKAIAEAKDLQIESTPFMRQHEWESREFEGGEVEGAKQYDIFVSKEAFKHLDSGESGQRQAMKTKFVELWCQEATKGDIIGTGGRGMVVELGGVNGANTRVGRSTPLGRGSVSKTRGASTVKFHLASFISITAQRASTADTASFRVVTAATMDGTTRVKRLNPAAPGGDFNETTLTPAKSIGGPFNSLNSTRAHIPSTAFGPKASHGVFYNWSSRNNRKGRHALRLSPSAADAAGAPPATSSIRVVLRGIIRMAVYYPIWDISYLIAVIFTLGSVVWVINAFFAFLPLLQPSTAFDGETLYGGGISAFIGATIFEFGSWLLILEAYNEDRSACFGWALETAIDGHTKFTPDKDNCLHHHQRQKKSLVAKSDSNPSSTEQPAAGVRSWTWLPSWHDLTTHYIYELGFLACASQLFGATVFWISGFTALPGIYNNLSPGLADGIYWTPQVVGGMGFVVSGVLFMIETQPKWYIPAFNVLGWHIGLWNLIGGVGFTICPIFGYYPTSWGVYQASCSTFWGSWAFLIGSAIQWYESLEKFPVEYK